MFTRIHCAVDESEGARRALAHAAALSEVLDVPLSLVYVAPDGPYPGTDRAAVERGRHAGWEAGQLLFAELRDELALGPDTTGVVLHGPAGERLVEFSEDDDLDLLIVGSRGHGGLRRVVLGSVSAHVSRRAACPVRRWLPVVSPGRC